MMPDISFTADDFIAKIKAWKPGFNLVLADKALFMLKKALS